MQALDVTESAAFDRLETGCLWRLCGQINEADEEKCNELLRKLEHSDALEKNKAPFIRNIHDRIQKIWADEDFRKFAELYKNTPPTDQNLIHHNQTSVAETGRTANTELFLDAFAALNEENIQTAAKYAIAKKKSSFSAAINVFKKNMYDTLTCQGMLLHPAMAAVIQQLSWTDHPNGNSGAPAQMQQPRQAPQQPNPGNAPAFKFCTSCGARLPYQANFCTKCGAKQRSMGK